MAANTVIALKKSAVPSSVPSNLANGEIAINYADGKLYYKNVAGQIVEFTPQTVSNYFGTVNANNTLIVADTSGDVFSLVAGDNVTIVGDAINDTITISASLVGGGDPTPAFNQANTARDSANAAYDQANAAYDAANNAVTDYSPAFIQANTSRTHANAAFEQANTATNDAANANSYIGTVAAAANSGTGAGANAFAVTIGISSNAWTNTSIAYPFNHANAAYDQANAAFNHANGAARLSFVTLSNDDQDVVADSNNDTLTVVGSNGILVLGNSYFDKINIGLTVTGVNQGSYGSLGFLNGTELAQVTYDVDKYGRLTGGTHSQVDLRTGLDPVYKKNAFSSIVTNADTVDSDSQEDTLTVKGANGVSILGASSNDSIWIALDKTSVTSTTYGGSNTQMPYFTVDAWGRLTSAGNVTITSADTAAAGANAYATTVGAASNNWANTVANYANGYSNSTFVKLTSTSKQTITSDVDIVGNLTLSGNTFVVDAMRLNVTDPLIYLAGNNYSSDIVDIGFIANYVNATGQNVHTGLYREHSDKEYYLFYGYDKEPENNHIGALSNNMVLAVLNADIRTSNLNLGGSNTILAIAAGNTYAQAVGAGANAGTGTGANAFASAVVLANAASTGTGANTYLSGWANNKFLANNVSNTATFTGSVFITGDFVSGNTKAISVVRTVPVVVNDAVDIGSFTFTAGGAVLSIAIIVPSTNFSVAKHYSIAVNYAETAGAWTIVQPISSGGPYSTNDYDLDINVNNNITSLRIRRTAGSTAGTAYVDMRFSGVTGDVFTGSTTSASVAAPTTYYNATQITQVDGLVGIGRRDPTTYKLDVNGTANASQLYINGTLATAISNNYTLQNALVNAAVGSANAFAYTGNLFITTGNVLVGRTVSSTIAGLRVDVLGGVNASALFVNGTPVSTSSGVTTSILSDTVSATRYLVFANNTSGTFSQANVTSGITVNPSTSSINAASLLINDAPVTPTGDFNTNIINGVGYAMTTSLGDAYTAPSTANKRYIVRSIHISNIGSVEATANGEFQGTNYANASFSATIPIPVGSSVELLKKPKIMAPSDILRLRADTASTLHAMISYEIQNGTSYFGKGAAATLAATYYDIHTATSASVLESLLLVNIDGSFDVKARVVWTDGSNVIQGYLCYDLIVPADSTVELLDMPKALPNGHKIRVYGNVGGRLEALIAGRAS